LNIGLLRGNMPSKEKAAIKEDLRSGRIGIIVGTHALLEEDVVFKNLGIVVTDEQHRFGVMQRSTLFNKGKNIDILVMTATPIPRTLALYLYGDLDVSIIDELPPGRQKIETFYIDERKKAKVYEFALKEIVQGRQVYVVCPLVEENEELSINSVEKLFNELSEHYFKGIDVAILHGKMPNKLKEDIMNKFKNNEIKVLISTTVIEVGINVPNATVMIIENAERFGLAQLHQLRGRVGRGSFKSYCILVANIKNEIVQRRLEIIQQNSDGFKIAEEDLKMRGSGELFGFRQHGENNLILADLINDLELLKLANSEAKKLLISNSKDDIDIKAHIFRQFEQTSKFICFN
jgi:ATP-dependent DNA helicase RecG